MQARKTLRCLKGLKRLRIVGHSNPVNKQTTATLSYIQSWNKLQAELTHRRAFMVTEGRNRKKKEENQVKLDAKLQNLQVNLFITLALFCHHRVQIGYLYQRRKVKSSLTFCFVRLGVCTRLSGTEARKIWVKCLP
jgi:hypothetical protein